jgi:CheY-like chemotaxis protein
MSLIAAIASAVSAPLSGRRVLVIEDEYFIADDMTRALASLGAEVIGPIGEIKEAQRILDAGTRIDGAVLDINIRSEMIFPLARTLRSRNVPFVFTTGYDKGSLGSEFDDVPVWEKPLDIPALVRSLADMILNRAG